MSKITKYYSANGVLELFNTTDGRSLEWEAFKNSTLGKLHSKACDVEQPVDTAALRNMCSSVLSAITPTRVAGSLRPRQDDNEDAMSSDEEAVPQEG